MSFSVSVIANECWAIWHASREVVAQLQRLPHGPRAELALGVGFNSATNELGGYLDAEDLRHFNVAGGAPALGG